MTSDETWGIGEAARRLRTTPRTLRYYEQRGLVPALNRDPGGQRRYNTEIEAQIRTVMNLRRLGLELSVIESLLNGDDTLMATVLQGQHVHVTQQVAELVDLQHRIDAVLEGIASHHVDTAEALQVLEEMGMNIALNTIYTRAGDTGNTQVAGGVLVDKTDPGLEAMGAVDELVSALGLAVAADLGTHQELVRSIQHDLFDVGADIASALADRSPTSLVAHHYVARLETICDELNSTLQPTESFILPGSNATSAAVHHARAICRRAERHAWALPGLPDADRRYLNRLSDLLFILARTHEEHPEPTWTPHTHLPAEPTS